MALKVLLADDSVPAQNMGKKILTEAGYEVLAVSNGLEALKKIADSVPDIAILDIFMPGYTGLEVCSRLRANAKTAELPVILTVGKLEPYRPEDGEKVQSNAVIVKPFATDELLSAVRSLVGMPFAIRDDAAEAKTPATPAPVATPAPDDDYEEEAPMLAGIGFDPDLKRSAFSASVVEDPPVGRVASAFEAAPAVEGRAASPAFSDFEFEPAAAAAGAAASATALVEWWQPTPDSVEHVDAAGVELASGLALPAADATTHLITGGGPALDDIRVEHEEQFELEAPAALPELRLAAAPALHKSASPTTAPIIEAPLPDRESRMQAFEALFNSDEPIPVEESPAALPDLLAQEELEAAQQGMADADSLLELEDSLGAALSIAAAEFSPAEGLESSPANAVAELQLDTESIESWLTAGELPSEPEPPVAATPQHDEQSFAGEPDSQTELESSAAPPVPLAMDSFYAGIPEDMQLAPSGDLAEALLETPSIAAAEDAPPMVCYLPKEAPEETSRESSIYPMLGLSAAELPHEETLTAQIEDRQPEAKQRAASTSAEELASCATEQNISSLMEPVLVQPEVEQAEAETEWTADDNFEASESLTTTAEDPGGEAKRIHRAVESVFERFRPLLIAAIARELTKRD